MQCRWECEYSGAVYVHGGPYRVDGRVHVCVPMLRGEAHGHVPERGRSGAPQTLGFLRHAHQVFVLLDFLAPVSLDSHNISCRDVILLPSCLSRRLRGLPVLMATLLPFTCACFRSASIADNG